MRVAIDLQGIQSEGSRARGIERYSLEIIKHMIKGFHDYDFIGNNAQKWKMLGNTIPTIFTEIIGKQIIKHTSFNSNV